jgi:GDP-L-fucose synthase
MNSSSKIYVAGHRGLLGSALVRRLRAGGHGNLLLRSHTELDLTDQQATYEFFRREQPEYVFLAAARVGGILANDTCPAEFIGWNLQIQTNVIHESWRAGARRLLFLGSSCIYPKHAAQQIKEEYLLTGPLEPTNQAYALAKISGIEMCRAYNRQYGAKFLAAMPANLYGPNDRYDLAASHVIPALIQKLHKAKVNGHTEAVVWGTGNPRREFLYSDDAADACVYLMNLPWETLEREVKSPVAGLLVNVGQGTDITIRELAVQIAAVVGFKGRLVFDASKPDGTPQKVLDVNRLGALGWRARTSLEEGLQKTYLDFREHVARQATPSLASRQSA